MFKRYRVECDSCDAFELVNPSTSYFGTVIGSKIHEYQTDHNTEICSEPIF